MDITELIEEVCANHPDKMLVDIAEFENNEHQSYKHLYELIWNEKQELEESNFTLVSQNTVLEKDLSEALKEIKKLKHENSIISQSLLPAMDSIKSFFTEKIFVSDVGTDYIPDNTYELKTLANTISDKPGIYGKFRPAWFTQLQTELSKENVQKKNAAVTSSTLIDKVLFWKNARKNKPEAKQIADEYDENRKEKILKLLSSDCTNEEKYLKYFLLTPGMDKEYFKTLQGASDLNIDARLVIALLEQPNDNFNKDVIEFFVSRIRKGTEYNLKQELAQELVRGEWYITAKINGNNEKFQVIPFSTLNSIATKIDAIYEYLHSSPADDELSAKLAESSSNNIQEQNYAVEDVSPFIDIDDSQIP